MHGYFEGTYLSNVQGVTQELADAAFGDAATKLLGADPASALDHGGAPALGGLEALLQVESAVCGYPPRGYGRD